MLPARERAAARVCASCPHLATSIQTRRSHRGAVQGVERELVSLLLAELNGQVFTPQNIQRGEDAPHRAPHRRHAIHLSPTVGPWTPGASWPGLPGFDLLLDRAEDLQVDTPQLIFLLARFLARAVADEAVPPKYIAALQEDRSLSKTASATVEEASILLTMKHGLARLSEIWGVGGGRRPVVQLGRKMHLIIQVCSRGRGPPQRPTVRQWRTPPLIPPGAVVSPPGRSAAWSAQEYLSAHDLDEAQRCLHELDVPHFHHELVYDSVVMAIEGTAAQVGRAEGPWLRPGTLERALTSAAEVGLRRQRHARSLARAHLGAPAVPCQLGGDHQLANHGRLRAGVRQPGRSLPRCAQRTSDPRRVRGCRAGSRTACPPARH